MEFKKEVVRKYLSGQSIAAISRETGVNENVLHRWKQQMIVKDGEPESSFRVFDDPPIWRKLLIS